jgi:hypothetical protein
MALLIQGNSGVILDVDGTSFRAMRVTARPVDYASFGHYQAAMTSGTIAAALAASAVVFSFRWGDSARLAVVTYISLKFQTLTLFTAAQLVDFGFDAYAARSFTASPTNQTAATLTGNSFKCRTSMGTTLLTDMRISATGAITGQTLTADGNAFAASLGDAQRVNPAAATEEQIVSPPHFEWCPQAGNGEHPLVLAQNEGFVIRNRTVWPAAGTGIVQAQVRWSEVSAY